MITSFKVDKKVSDGVDKKVILSADRAPVRARSEAVVIYILCECSQIYAIACTIVVEAPRFAHQVGRRLRGLLSGWVSLGLNDLRSPPTLSDDSHDTN